MIYLPICNTHTHNVYTILMHMATSHIKLFAVRQRSDVYKECTSCMVRLGLSQFTKTCQLTNMRTAQQKITGKSNSHCGP